MQRLKPWDRRGRNEHALRRYFAMLVCADEQFNRLAANGGK